MTTSIGPGKPYPLGPSVINFSSHQLSVNIAVYSETPLSVLIFPPTSLNKLLLREPLNWFPITNRTANVYHISIHGLPQNAAYAFHPNGSHRLLHDPYAKYLQCRSVSEWMTLPAVSPHNRNPGIEFERLLNAIPTLHHLQIRHPFILSFFKAPPDVESFDWQGFPHPCIPHENMVVYEAHIRALSFGGTFESAVNVIPYLEWLGVTTLQLMPVLEFDETETSADHRISKPNMWGYSPASWFMPMGRYSGHSAATGLKMLVRELHRAGIECILDVVYNHSSHASWPLHFFGVQRSYYIGRPTRSGFHHSNISGCGNTLSPNSPLMADAILDSLRWFVAEYHIDGFRIDAAGVFCRDSRGNPIQNPVIMERIAEDPLLKNTKIIVEGWDAGDQIGSPNMLLGRFPKGEIVSEWNPWWRDAVRKFWRGDGSEVDFREALRGCPQFFKKRKPYGACHGLNFVACHDGFCLADVVSYTKRVNSDGYDEVSFNCGEEGSTMDETVNCRRAQQMRNMVFTLAVSRGIPMILQGDELGISKQGNSNTWNCPELYAGRLPEKPQDVSAHEGLVQFTRHMIHLRRNYPQLTGSDFHSDVAWINTSGKRIVDRKETKRGQHKFVAFLTAKNSRGVRLFVAMNSGTSDVMHQLPDVSVTWELLIDTSKSDWLGDLAINKEADANARITQRSSVLYVGRSP